jgi:acyl-CoA reductase-like NAD-dependent aldehyde dehydrogenase
LGALIIGEVLAETDLPTGAFSILPCSNEDASALVEDERIALLSFTGGLVGWDMKARAGRKKVTLELGGNAACIVDADPGRPLDEVVERLVFGAYYQSGQSCISVQRILVHRDLPRCAGEETGYRGEEAQGRRSARRGHLHRTGDRRSAAKRIDDWIADAIRGGAKALVRGKRTGNLLGASLLRDVPRDADLYRKEAFGPVACIEAFDDFDEAIARVNDSDFGLQAGVFTARGRPNR